MDLYSGMEYVYTVYKEKSFTKAAKKLFIAQPSLSARIKHIEEKLGYPIFDRGAKPVALTECGKRYIDSIEKMMIIENEFTDYLEDLENPKVGKIVIGGDSQYISYVLPPVLADFNEMYPHVHLKLVEESPGNLLTAVQRDEVDIVLTGLPLNTQDFESFGCGRECVLLAVPATNKVNEKLKKYCLTYENICRKEHLNGGCVPVSLRMFSGEMFVLTEPKKYTRTVAEKLFQNEKMYPQITMEADNAMTAYSITCSGFGISLVSDVLACGRGKNQAVVYYKLPLKYSSREICFAWKAERYLTKAMQEFLEISRRKVLNQINSEYSFIEQISDLL